MITIPKLHFITQGNKPQDHIDAIQKACTSGIELVQLRLKDTSKKSLLKAAMEAREITSHYQTRLIINDHYKIAKEVKADGVHLGKTDADPKKVRALLYSWQLVGGTANTFQDCESLIKKEVDYIGLGPFRLTDTKKNLSPILDIIGYQEIIAELNTDTPIIAIGGITIKDVDALLKTGISGIAVSKAITENYDGIKDFHKLLQAGSSMEQQHNFKK